MILLCQCLVRNTINERITEKSPKCSFPRQDFTRYSASEAEELENLDGVGHFQLQASSSYRSYTVYSLITSDHTSF